MNYTELKENIAEITENSYTDSQLAQFAVQAEETIFNAIQFPALRKNQRGFFSSGNSYLTVPTDFLYPFSLAAEDGDGVQTFLLNKDVNFIREAYPDGGTGAPKYYAIFDEDTLIVGPTPDSDYTAELHYGAYPESITVAVSGRSWLGDNFSSLLLNACLVEAARFMKAETDVMAMYEKRYGESLKLAKMLGDGKTRQDTYRTGQVRVPVR